MNLERVQENMEAGRELDRLIAEKVMGCKPYHNTFYDYEGYKSYSCPCYSKTEGHYPHNIYLGHTIKPYSADISAAWLVVDKIKDKGVFTIQRGRQIQEGLWEVGYYYDDYENCFESFTGKAETVPLAICRFALLTLISKP